MPRFVVLFHRIPKSDPDSGDTPRELIGRGNHWDLMLESGNSLQTWALPFEPRVGREGAVVPLPDHRINFLEYEGELTRDRGSVERVFEGSYELLEYDTNRKVFELSGSFNCLLTIQTRQLDLKDEQSNKEDSSKSEWYLKMEPLTKD